MKILPACLPAGLYVCMYVCIAKNVGTQMLPLLNHAQGLGYRNLDEVQMTCPCMSMRQKKLCCDMIPPNASCNLHIPQSFVGWTSVIFGWPFEVDQVDHSLELTHGFQVSFFCCCIYRGGQVGDQILIIHVGIALTYGIQHHQFSFMIILRTILSEN